VRTGNNVCHWLYSCLSSLRDRAGGRERKTWERKRERDEERETEGERGKEKDGERESVKERVRLRL